MLSYVLVKLPGLNCCKSQYRITSSDPYKSSCMFCNLCKYPPVLMLLFTMYTLQFPLLSEVLVSILPSITGKVGATVNTVLPSSNVSTSTTSKLSEFSIVTSVLVLVTPFSFPILNVNIESSVDIAPGLDISYPNPLLVIYEPTLEEYANDVCVKSEAALPAPSYVNSNDLSKISPFSLNEV